MRLRDVMTREVEEIPPSATLQEAAERMRTLDVGVLPICDGQKVVGMLTDRDIAVRAVANGKDPCHTPVTEAMTPDLIFCYEDDDVTQAAQLMEQRQIRRLLVMDRQKRAVGIVSLGDLAVRTKDDRLSGEVLERVSEQTPQGNA